MGNQNNSSSGITIAGVLLIVFVTLKILGLITWSWVWVLAPLWITIIINVTAYYLIISYYKRLVKKNEAITRKRRK